MTGEPGEDQGPGDGTGRLDEDGVAPDGDPRQEERVSHPGLGSAEAVDRADYDPSYDPSAPVYCEVCGAEMYYTASCKLTCPRCGYTRDCSDP